MADDALLARLKDELPITGTAYDQALNDKLAAARAIIARKVGPLTLSATTTTRTVRALDGDTLVLPTAAPATLDTVGGVAWAGEAPSYGVVTGTFVPGQRYVVTYRTGFAALPADLAEAVVELAKHLWRSRQGPSARPGDDNSSPTYLIPYRVAELIEGYAMPGIA